MAFIGLKVPHEAARLLAGIDFGDVGDRESTDFLHVTLHMLGDDVPIEALAAALKPIFEVVSKTPPFLVSTSHITTFPPNPESGVVPVIGLIDSPELHTLHSVLGKALDKAGISYSKKYPVYRPHVTLAYSKDPLVDGGIVNTHLQVPVAWGAHELVLWGGDSGDNRIVVTLPFAMPPIVQPTHAEKTASASKTFREASYRAAVRLSLWAGRPGWRRIADDRTPAAPCPKCGGEPVYDDTLDAFVCPTCGIIGDQGISRRVAARFRGAPSRA
jgi:2'-5' RNA ligase